MDYFTWNERSLSLTHPWTKLNKSIRQNEVILFENLTFWVKTTYSKPHNTCFCFHISCYWSENTCFSLKKTCIEAIYMCCRTKIKCFRYQNTWFLFRNTCYEAKTFNRYLNRERFWGKIISCGLLFYAMAFFHCQYPTTAIRV